MTGRGPERHDRSMDLPAPLAWLVDEAGDSAGPDQFLADLGSRLVADGLPLAGGALTLAVPHPIIARRTWLWRPDTGSVIEALGFAGGPLDRAGRDWLAKLGPVLDVGPERDSPVLNWSGASAFSSAESSRLHQVARFAVAPLAALAARSALTALLEAYLGRRSAARVQAGALRRGTGETIRAALFCADLRGFTALSEATEPAAMIATLDAWFDRVAGAVHAFGGEVLKFIGDGVLAIFPVTGSPADACEAGLRAVTAARAGMNHLDATRQAKGLPPLPFGAALHHRRDPVGQYRCGRPAGLHRHRASGEPGQPVGRAMPPPGPVGADFRRCRGRNHHAGGAAWRAHAPRHRGALRRVHSARCLTRPVKYQWEYQAQDERGQHRGYRWVFRRFVRIPPLRLRSSRILVQASAQVR